MARPEKVDAIEEFKSRLSSSAIAIATRFTGIKADQVTALRKKLRDSGIKFKVYKNTLAARALSELGFGDAVKFMDGPTAWAFADDLVAPSKILRDFNKEVPAVDMNGGIIEGKVVNRDGLIALADMPPREVLVAQVVGVMAMPLRSFVGVLNAPLRDTVTVLDQIKKKKEETTAAA